MLLKRKAPKVTVQVKNKMVSTLLPKEKTITNDNADYANTISELQSRIAQLEQKIAVQDHALFKDIPAANERENTQYFERLYKINGPLKSTKDFSEAAKRETNIHYQHREKAEIALTACSIWHGGDYFEFGALDLNTFRNMLTTYDMADLMTYYPDVRFYAFDIFGDPTISAPSKESLAPFEEMDEYFAPYMAAGDQMELHGEYIKQHGLFRDKCHLVQGLFENTMTPEFKAQYLAEGRKIGFAFLDCNMPPSYKWVFEYIVDMMAEESYIYMDEYFQNPAIPEYFQQLTDVLRKKRNMGALYMRNAAGFGALFRLYPLGKTKNQPLEIKS